jgi:carboxypeptidase D
MAYNNTYDLQLINKTVYEQALHGWNKPGGGRDLMLECRKLQAKLDPDQLGANEEVNKACLKAEAAFSFVFSLNGPSNVRHPLL